MPSALPKNTQEHRQGGDALQRGRISSAQVRDIGPPPAVADAARRATCETSLSAFLTTYFPAAFPLRFSRDHDEVIAALEHVTQRGGQYAMALPRGSGKTTIVVRAALWAILTGRRRYVAVVSSTDAAAKKIVKSMRTELTWNDLLYADFPRELHGIPQLQGDNRRAGGQLCEGEKTEILMGVTELVFPTIAGSRVSGSVVSACGLTGNVRGQFHATKSGEILRPDLAILDDPQTKESASSLQQTQDRLEIVEGDVLGMAGPGKEIAAVMPCTVIEEDDLADRVLKMPLWRGKRAKMLVSFPSNLDWWENYFRVRDGDRDEAQALYVAEQETADAGACVAWEERRAPSDASALQTAMHLWHQSPTAFAAEYQNEPRPKTQVDAELMKAEAIAAKLNHVPRGIVPAELETLTAFIDVQDHALFWLVTAWGKGFGGAIVDYGSWPDQSRDYWAYSDIRQKLGDVYPGRGSTGAIYAGLTALVTELTGRSWNRAGGGVVRLARVLIDSGHETDTIYLACRQHPMAALLMPTKGIGVTAARTPMDSWAKKTTDVKRGPSWIASRGEGRGIVHAVYDTNFWKSFVQARLATSIGDAGSLVLCGDKPELHRLLADHLTAEYRTATRGHGRDLWEWKLRPDRKDNHWLDCLVGSAVAASIEGCGLPEWGSDEPRRKRVEIPSRLRMG